jgi:hypothetical protein
MNNAPESGLMAALNRQPGLESLQLVRTVSVRVNSVVYLAQRPDSGERIALKVCRDQAGDQHARAAARVEFQALQTVHQRSERAGAACLVPKPLALLEDFGAYAMTWVEGPSLTLMLGQAWRGDAMQSAFESAGSWLGAFHKAGPLRQGVADLSAKARHLQAMTELPLAHPLFTRGLRQLSSTYAQMQARPLWISWLHGDCKTDNFLLTRGGIVGIDIALGHENAVEHDLAQFLNQIDLLATGIRFWHRRLAIQALSRAFAKGYSQHGPGAYEPFLLWLRLWSALTFWHTKVVEQQPMWLKRWVLNWQFSSLVRGLLRGQAQARPNNQSSP